MVLVNFKENIQILMKLKESLIPQADGNFVSDWETEARKYQGISELIILELKEIPLIEGFVRAISSQLSYLGESLSNYFCMSDFEKDKFKRLYVLAALGLIAKLKLILLFSAYINSSDNGHYVNDPNTDNTKYNVEYTGKCENEHHHSVTSDSDKDRNVKDTYVSSNDANDHNHNIVVDDNGDDENYNDQNIYDNYNKQNNYIAKNSNDSIHVIEDSAINENDINIHTYDMYSNYTPQCISDLVEYNSSSIINKNIYYCAQSEEIKEVCDSVDHGNLMNAENLNTTNDTAVMKSMEDSGFKENFALNQQSKLNTLNTYYGNEQMNNCKDSTFTNVYGYNAKQTTSAAEQIYKLLTHMQVSSRASSSSASSTASANNYSHNFKENCYIPENRYYQLNDENSQYRHMSQYYQTPNLSDDMYRSSIYY